MKTIFITSFYQYISRNILKTPILDGLLGVPDLRIVIIVPKDKKNFFEEEFKGRKIIIESVDISRSANGFLSLFLTRVSRGMLGVRYKEVARGFKVNKFRDGLIRTLFYLPLRILGKFYLMHDLMRWFNLKLLKNKAHNDLFDKYSPDIVFSTDVYNENDVLMATEAKRRKIKIISMIRSWDNVQMYGVIRVIPDELLLWGDFVKDEVLKFNKIDPSILEIVGVPHYDRYLKGSTMSREEFFNSIGADISKKLIFFTPVGDMYLKKNDVDGLVLSILSELDANILVRMPPADNVSWGNSKPASNIFFYQPGRAGKKLGRNEIDREDDDHLINSIYFSDVVISGPSTIMLDALMINKPVVLFGFESQKKVYKDSILSLYDSHHLQAVIKNCGAYLAKNIGDFRSKISEYIQDPKKDQEIRDKVVNYICFKKDGRSSQRVFEIINKYI